LIPAGLIEIQDQARRKCKLPTRSPVWRSYMMFAPDPCKYLGPAREAIKQRFQTKSSSY